MLNYEMHQELSHDQVAYELGLLRAKIEGVNNIFTDFKKDDFKELRDEIKEIKLAVMKHNGMTAKHAEAIQAITDDCNKCRFDRSEWERISSIRKWDFWKIIVNSMLVVFGGLFLLSAQIVAKLLGWLS